LAPSAGPTGIGTAAEKRIGPDGQPLVRLE